MTKARIIADSISPSGVRLTTFEFTYPRWMHSELMTYRVFSRNAASSRAIPVTKTLKWAEEDPAMPVFWGRNQPGMQARQELSKEDIERCKIEWLTARDNVLRSVRTLMEYGLHKQTANRLLEPWLHIVTLVTATDFANMFHQRDHEDAQPEFHHLARLAWYEYNHSTPTPLGYGEYHLPFIKQEDREEVTQAVLSDAQHEMDYQGEILAKLKAISVGRCARVSFVNHEGKRSLEEDISLHDRLKGANPGHWSPFEHVARPTIDHGYYGNLRGWKQYRKEFSNENILTLPEWNPNFRPCHGCLGDVAQTEGPDVMYCLECL